MREEGIRKEPVPTGTATETVTAFSDLQQCTHWQCTFNSKSYLCTCVCMHACVYVYVCVTCVCVCVCVSVCVCMCECKFGESSLSIQTRCTKHAGARVSPPHTASPLYYSYLYSSCPPYALAPTLFPPVMGLPTLLHLRRKGIRGKRRGGSESCDGAVGLSLCVCHGGHHRRYLRESRNRRAAQRAVCQRLDSGMHQDTLFKKKKALQRC